MQVNFWLISTVVVLLFSRVSKADLVVYEGFQRGSSGQDLLLAGGGIGFSSVWETGGFNAALNDNFDIASGSLTYGGMPNAGGHATTSFTNSIAGLRRTLTQSIGPSQTFFLSVLLRPEGTIGQGPFGGFFGLYLDSTNGDENDLFLGKPGNANQFTLENRGGVGASISNVSAISGQTSFLVLKGELQAGNDIFTLWVDRPLGSAEPVDFDARKTDLDLNSFDALVLYSTGAFSIDEIRIGQSFADVTAVPEPGSFLLAAASWSGFMIVVRRRWSRIRPTFPR